MGELALNILDLAQNAVAAQATLIRIEVAENEEGFLVFRIADNGRGMEQSFLEKVRDPFVTTRTTRKVGMGIPLVDMAAQQCGGRMDITSRPGKGTEVTASFRRDNIDCPPLGDVAGSIAVLLAGAPATDVLFSYKGSRGDFVFDSRNIREELGEACDFSHPELAAWVRAYLQQEIDRVKEEGRAI